MSRISVQDGPRASVFGNLNDYDDSSSESNDSEEESSQKDVPSWDLFKTFPTPSRDGSMQNNNFFKKIIWTVKVLVYGLLFAVVFCGAIAAKSAVLFATSQLQKNRLLSYYDFSLEIEGHWYVMEHTQGGLIKWTWCLIFIFLVPECISLLNALWYFSFKKKPEIPSIQNLLLLIMIETGHTIGLVLLTFVILPDIGAVQGAVIFCCLCFVPALLNLLSQNGKNRNLTVKMITLFFVFDILSLVAQLSGMFLRPLIEHDVSKTSTWLFPIALLLCSIRWWGNFVSSHSNIGLLRYLSSVKKNLEASQHIVQGGVSIWRTFIFIAGVLIVNMCDGINVEDFLSPKFSEGHKIRLVPATPGDVSHDHVFFTCFTNIVFQEHSYFLIENGSIPFYVLAVQAVCAIVVYQACKFAYRSQMHQFGFAFPTSLVSFGTVCLIVSLCITRNKDICAFNDVVPDYLLFGDTTFRDWREFFTNWYVWCWPIWLLSQIWITMHLWTTENERLALVEKIFSTIIYDSLMIDQGLALNRRTQYENVIEDDKRINDNTQFPNGILRNKTIGMSLDNEISQQELNDIDLDTTDNKRKDRVTKIYACATMWHEEKNEMNQLINSILRLDKDQCAMYVTQKHYKIYIKDYYELETHIFFDDAFCCMHGCIGSCDHDENETQVNQYVEILVETVQRNVENMYMRSSPPIKYPTPYGGRLMWTLPGKTQLIVHLKDNNKIRHRKRWSQVMYMYYLLGYRLMALPIDVDRKEIIAANTYILTLDGDIDFQPSAVKVLVDLMKKDKDLGAACGRIHPVGSGPIVWIQKFEYAIGHWLQKSTEHTIGCVLCSPGCFSLFRANALMQNNVMAKYATKSTEARHYIQYDQGEDRWLCTLLLQVGSRVEYSAASDAYTHAPEVFKDVFIQRRRWIPSTLANIFDLLMTARLTRKKNNDISWLYIAYQWVLMGSTILGPGTIFLMLVGAFVSAFHIDNWTSFLYNLIPIGVFVGVCFTCKERIQLLMAEIISVIYGLVMIIVLVGIMLQIAEDGWLAPSSLLFFIVAIQLIVAGLLHPQEWTCLLCGVIYYITVPSMYMLLTIFSIFNVHNVTWGTREKKKNISQEEQRSSKTGNSGNVIGKWNKQNKNQKDGSLDFSLGNLFRCICCINTGISHEERRLNEINDSLQQIDKRLRLLDRLARIETSSIIQSSPHTNKYTRLYSPIEETIEEGLNQDIELQHIRDDNKSENGDGDEYSDVLTQMSVTSSHEHSSFLISPYWLQDERMRKGEVDFLSNHEEEFWKELIEKYLRPIETDEESQKKITQELMECRNSYLLRFFMLNALLVLSMFLMQLNKEVLHLQWPLSIKYNITYVEERSEVHLTKQYLRLEPIGCLFIIGFISILGIQFIAMLIHRFDTFTHVLANMKIKLFCCTKVTSSEDSTVENDADVIAQGLQRMAEDDITNEYRRTTMTASNRRRTVHELTQNSQSPLRKIGNFEKLFRRKLRNPNVSGLSQHISSRMSKSAFSVFERRRSTILAKRKKQQPYDIYDNANDLRNSSDTQLPTLNANQFQYDNPGFRQDENI
ncbi:chitin synthase chs-2-like [Odontomachus brunneus]|uniref:chitin synthase chs-2-like n=1 Tax=Odontomachus brunneus TaxID=486640 RepID=UPI0013F2392C|nr:chitin synthase chs-2-like [Odontomachus brunneus]